MTWGTVGKILATFAGLWFVMIIMAWLSLAILQSAADEMIGGAMWKEYPLHDKQTLETNHTNGSNSNNKRRNAETGSAIHKPIFVQPG